MEQHVEGALSGAGEVLGSVGEKARTIAGSTLETVEERGAAAIETVRGTTGNAQATLADAFDSSARLVRERIPGKAGETVGGGLEQAALWLRETDLSDPAALLQQQLKEHPGRTALVALAAGLVIGRASSRK